MALDWTTLLAGFIGAAFALLSNVVVQALRNRSHMADRTASPYGDMAQRLSVVEAKAAHVPTLEAKLWMFHLWSLDVLEWATQVREIVNGTFGDELPPMPSPPNVADRRVFTAGPPFGRDRRHPDDPTPEGARDDRREGD